MGAIFISYRREDSAPYAGRICDRLGAGFGSQHIFMDVEDIAPGTDFAEAIENTVGKCDVLVAVIGPRWLESLRNRTGDNNQHDYVSTEISTALRRGVTVIPVLVGGALMPSGTDMPAELSGLARRHALAIRDSDFDQDTNNLIEAIRRATGGGRSARRMIWLVVLSGLLVAVVGSALLLRASREKASLNGTWIARMQRPGQRPYNIRLQFQVSGRTLTGQVDYPTGSGAIQGGTVDANNLAFFTRHTPQFESEPAQIVFSGEIRGREVQLTATTPDGTTSAGIARKSQ